MQAWNDLVRDAVVGTDRGRHVPPALPRGLAEVIGPLPEASPEEALLSAAAALGTWRAAGCILGETPDIPPPFAPCGEETPYASPGAARALEEMMQEAPQALSESLARFSSRGLLVPPALLPALFDAAQRSVDMRPAVAGVMGRRGLALARERGDWNFMLANATELDTNAWDGNLAERTAYLRGLRMSEPARARALLVAEWRSEPAVARRDFLGALQVELSAEDEPFLESCLDDRSKEVRAAAIALLACLPASAFVARMNTRARMVLRLPTKSSPETAPTGILKILANKVHEAVAARTSTVAFDFEPPMEADDAAKRDGLETPPKWGNARQRGPRATMLSHIAATASLDVWEQTTNLTPGQIISRALATEWSGEVIPGWMVAARCQRNSVWARALFGSTRDDGEYRHARLAMLAVLPPEESDRLAVDLLRTRIGDLPLVLEARSGPMSIGLTLAIQDSISERIGGGNAPADPTTVGCIQLLCLRGDASLYPEIAQRLASCAQRSDGLSKSLERALRVYQLRHTLHKETAR